MRNHFSKYVVKHLNARNTVSSKGYTIIEVLIALAIFSIGVMAMSALQSSSLMATGDVARKTEAWTILENRVETLKALPFYIGTVAGGITTFDPATVVTPADLSNGNHNNTALPLYDLYWQVVDDAPISIRALPTNKMGKSVKGGNYTVSKTISVQVTLNGGNPLTDALAEVQFVKTWAESGQPFIDEQ